MRALFTVFGKEFLENLRDRRTLVSALLFGPLFGPLLFGAMVSRMLDQSVAESDEPLKITISGAEQAPNLRRYLESQGVTLTLSRTVRGRGSRGGAEPRRAGGGHRTPGLRAAIRRGDARPVAAGGRQFGCAGAQECGSGAPAARELRQRHRAVAPEGTRGKSAARRAGGGQRDRRDHARPGAPWWFSAS